MARNGGRGPSERGKTAPDPWKDRVAIARSAGRSFAYRPDRVLVARGSWKRLAASTRRELLNLVGGKAPAVEDKG